MAGFTTSIEDLLFRKRVRLTVRTEALDQAVIALVRVGRPTAKDAVLEALSEAAIVADRRHASNPVPDGDKGTVREGGTMPRGNRLP